MCVIQKHHSAGAYGKGGNGRGRGKRKRTWKMENHQQRRAAPATWTAEKFLRCWPFWNMTLDSTAHNVNVRAGVRQGSRG